MPILVAPGGIEPTISALKGLYPVLLDQGAKIKNEEELWVINPPLTTGFIMERYLNAV